MAIPSLDDSLAPPNAVRGLRVLVRADLNVPLRNDDVADDSRLRASLPTLRRLIEAGARVIVASHLGRPKGHRRPDLSLKPVAARLGALLGLPVRFVDECVGPGVEQAVASLTDGEVLILENLRFHSGEEANDPEFARALAQNADAYVNDAFGTAHRAHASTVGIVAHVERVAAGDLLREETLQLGRLLSPERPFLCLLGGAKVSDKLSVLEALAQRADVLAIGGAMAYTFLLTEGVPTGDSRVEPDAADAARQTLRIASEAGHRVCLPSDHVVAQEVRDGVPARIVKEIPSGWKGVDIGPETSVTYAGEARGARTIFWNGPMGVFEVDAFAKGTESVARAVADSLAQSVVGGGDSLAAVARAGVADRITHLSTGGGASLEMVEGRTLPAIAALER